MFETTAINLAPNYFWDDILLILKLILNPFSWQKSKKLNYAKRVFKRYFGQDYQFWFFDSGRSALTVALKALHLPAKSEVLLQAFSCVVLANSIKKANLIPVFVDVASNSFLMDLKDLKQKITRQSKVVILQNLFGFPDKIKEVQKLCRQRGLILIEDCAQSLGATYKGKKIGKFGEIAIFSFGKDKVISAGSGGMLMTKNKKLAKDIQKIYQTLPSPSYFWALKQLFSCLIFFLATPLYFFLRLGKFSLGKAILFFFQQLGIFNPVVSKEEKKGQISQILPKKFSDILLVLLLNQLNKLSQFNKKRIKIAQFYFKNLKKLKNVQIFNYDNNYQPIFLRYPLKVESPRDLLKFAQKKKIILGNWYDQVIAPKKTLLSKVGYKKGSCPQAEQLAQEMVNLPTYPKMKQKDVQRVVNCLYEYYQYGSKSNKK